MIWRAMAWTSATVYEDCGARLTAAAARVWERLAASAASLRALASAAAFCFATASLAACLRAASSASFLALASAAMACASACCVRDAVCTWACWPAGMSARRVESLAIASASFDGWPVLPEATPLTAPTAVTAVAEATASPRTEIRLTRFPSSIARLGDPRGRNRAPERWPPNCGVTGGTGPVGNSRDGSAAWCAGGIRRLYGVLVFLRCGTAGGTRVSYAGPDRNETL